jgi:hypothetical protein
MATTPHRSLLRLLGGSLRPVAGALVALLLATLSIAALPGAASAADGFKYWNYFHVEGGKYVFAQTGPADFTPKDGSVEAYRYGLSSTADGLPPRTDASTYTVDQICKGTEAQSGEKLVGVLLDYGTTADAEGGQTPPEPRAACAAVPTDANGQQVLDAVADVRVQDQLTCGIDGYPVKGCSVTVKNAPAASTEQAVDFSLPEAATATDPSATKAAAETDDDGGVAWPLVGVLAAVVVLGGGAFALSRRNRAA